MRKPCADGGAAAAGNGSCAKNTRLIRGNVKRLKTIPAPLSSAWRVLEPCARPPTPQAVPLLPPESVFAPVSNRGCKGDLGRCGVHLALQTSLHICAGQVETLNAWRATLPPR